MKDRLLTLALALGAFVAFYIVMAPKLSTPEEQPTRPISVEAGPNGYLGLARWLEAERVPVLSLRERFTKLNELPGLEASTGNLLVSTAPHIYPIRDTEVAPLRAWVRQGNTMLLVAGLSDTPDWSMGEGVDTEFLEHLQDMTALSFTQMPNEASEQSDDTQDADDEPPPSWSDAVDAQMKLVEPQKFEMKPAAAHPLLTGVSKVRALSEYPTAKWDGWFNETGAMELAHDPVSGAPVLWLLPAGQGQIIVSAYGSILTNKLLAEDGNAQLLANIVRWSLRDGGKVIVDDAHQGMVAFYDPEAFFGDSRLHVTLWWLLGLWLLFVVGSQRLRPAPSRWSPVDITGFVRASGGFMARVMRPATAGQQMIANFFNDARKRLGLPADGAPVWEWLRAQPAVSTQDVERLQAWHAKVHQGRRVDLSQLHNLLVRLRAALT
ncbi:DUF4350 domain-containing protein [Steroidobacter sp.]|uniref:DUF4350 domain-containing protein n=1 Tax=Steroidobacter sp. TaxID=1978227 RepID=UPI001A5E41E2|nr:DUF4350 domain-containing protein [Steroidobacter sp.]MBL8266218.1 DUF4350 domain-containing protein [Steroidobacter sp.]